MFRMDFKIQFSPFVKLPFTHVFGPVKIRGPLTTLKVLFDQGKRFVLSKTTIHFVSVHLFLTKITV